MGVLSHPKGLPLLLKLIDQIESYDKCLQIGYMVINARMYHLTHAIDSCSDELRRKYPFGMFKEKYSEDRVHNKLVFGMFKVRDVVDNYYSKNPISRATIKHDMNYLIDSAYYNSYELIVDSGTCEHIFNYPQALININLCTKVNGYVFHFLPANGWLEHGLTQFSSEALMEWYFLNGFEVVEAFYSKQSVLIDYYSRESLDMSKFQIIDLIKSDRSSIVSFLESPDFNSEGQQLVTDVIIVAKKVKNVSSFRYPQQKQWAQHWEAMSI